MEAAAKLSNSFPSIPYLVGNRDGKKRTKRKRGSVFAGFAFVIGVSYLVENITWMKSIRNDMRLGSSSNRVVDSKQNKSSRRRNDEGSAFCLLIKDDNDILSEWVAYHYHVFQMRRLIVAVDPDSKTSPLDVLDSWIQNHDHFGLSVTLWNDKDFTPEYFHSTNVSKLDYSKLPNSVENSIKLVEPSQKSNSAKLFDPIRKTDWHANETYVQTHQEEVRKEIIKINNHRFRQKTFVSECFRQIKTEEETKEKQRQKSESYSSSFWSFGKSKESEVMGTISWSVHIDTDEYLVPNPWIASYIRNESDTAGDQYFKREALVDIFPQAPIEGSLWKLFKKFLKKNKKVKSRPICLMMPRILFGSKEDPNNATAATTKTVSISADNSTNKFSWNHTKFESLRWKYHADFESEARPKSMINTIKLRDDDDILRKRSATSIHRPLRSKLSEKRNGCPGEPLKIYNERRFMQPIAVYHYLGSMERYLSRMDARRDKKTYGRFNIKGSYAEGDGNGEDQSPQWWIGRWLDSFVAVHGGEKAYAVLPEPYGTRQKLK